MDEGRGGRGRVEEEEEVGGELELELVDCHTPTTSLLSYSTMYVQLVRLETRPIDLIRYRSKIY